MATGVAAIPSPRASGDMGLGAAASALLRPSLTSTPAANPYLTSSLRITPPQQRRDRLMIHPCLEQGMNSRRAHPSHTADPRARVGRHPRPLPARPPHHRQLSAVSRGLKTPENGKNSQSTTPRTVPKPYPRMSTLMFELAFRQLRTAATGTDGEARAEFFPSIKRAQTAPCAVRPPPVRGGPGPAGGRRLRFP